MKFGSFLTSIHVYGGAEFRPDKFPETRPPIGTLIHSKPLGATFNCRHPDDAAPQSSRKTSDSRSRNLPERDARGRAPNPDQVTRLQGGVIRHGTESSVFATIYVYYRVRHHSRSVPNTARGLIWHEIVRN